MFWPPRELTLSEAYIYDDFDIEGDLEAVFGAAPTTSARERCLGLFGRLRLIRRLLALPSERRPRVGRDARSQRPRPSLERDRQAIAPLRRLQRLLRAVARPAHGLLVRLLHRRRTRTSRPPSSGSSTTSAASCGCGRASGCSTSAAAGAGWSCTPCEHYGVEAIGVTITPAQAELARERIRRGRARVPVPGRAARLPRGRRGRGASTSSSAVGMYEHVARARCSGLLRPGVAAAASRAASSSTTPSPARRPGPDPVGTPFVDLYVFPDHELVPVSTVLSRRSGRSSRCATSRACASTTC